MSPLDPDATLPPPVADPVDAPTLNYLPDGPADTRTLPPAATPTATSPNGRPEVPGFEMLKELGRGGMGVVYLARQIRLNRPVALKMVLAGGHASPQERLRFLAEAESVAAVQHPGIVQVFEFGTAGEQPYFALEFCPGGSLAGKLAGTPLPPAEAAALVEKIAAAVQAAHDKGIVHRDLKPDNVLFAADGTPKVTDFGLARKVEGDSGLTRTGAIMGTPSYMAPEQAAGKGKEVGPPADVYALGAILYECLTGRPPFRAATALDTVLQVANEEPVSPRRLVPNMPRDAETICLKCLQKEPGKRYPSAGALAADLRRFVDGEPVTARPVSWVETRWKQARRRPLVAGLTFLAAFFAAFAGITFLRGVQRDRDAHDAAIRHLAELDKEATAARQAGAAAETARQKAQQRLEKAVEAVERLLARVGSERWSRDPALAAERRRVLEDVVAFYEGFNGEDAADPLVRRETAKAYRQIGLVYELLAEFPKADAALARSRTILDGLVAEAPDHAGYADDLAETILFVAYTAHSEGRIDAAQTAYTAAAAAARRAAAAGSAGDGPRRTLVSCLVSLGYFTLPTDARAATAHFAEAVGHADRLVARPDAPFPNRVLAAYAYTGAGTADLVNGQIQSGLAATTRAANLIAATTPDPTAPGYYRDLFDTTVAVLKLMEAVRFVVAGQPAKAADLLRTAAVAFDDMLAVYPKAFHYRMFKFQVLLLEVDVLTTLGRSDDLRRRQAELFAVEDAILATSPAASYIKRQTALRRSMEIVQRVRHGKFDGLDAAAGDALATAAEYKLDGVRYNVACALSLASRTGPAADREARAVKAVRLLTDLLDTRFYTGLTNAAHIDKDTDLDPLRDRADYQAFRQKVRELAPAKKK